MKIKKTDYRNNNWKMWKPNNSKNLSKFAVVFYWIVELVNK